MHTLGLPKAVTFTALTLDATLDHRPQAPQEPQVPEAPVPSAKKALTTVAPVPEHLATATETFGVAAPVVSFATVPARIASGGKAKPVKIAVDNGTGSNYDKTFPYFFVLKQDLLDEDDADKVIVNQDGKRVATAQSDPGIYGALSKLSLPAGQTKNAQLEVGFAQGVTPGKAFLVTALADKATKDGAKLLSTNYACKEIEVTEVDDSTPTPTPTDVTSTPSPTDTPATDTQGSPLASTGANIMAGLLGAILLIAGIAAVVVTRRRKTAAEG